MNNNVFQHLPVDTLFSIVKNDLRKLDNEGLIDEGTLIKTVQWCNEKLGIPIRDIKEKALEVVENRAELPKDFEKLFYVCAIGPTNSMVTSMTNPWDNNFDQDVIYDAELNREKLGCVDNYEVVIKRQTNTTVYNYGSWVQLEVDKSSQPKCHIDCPNLRKPGRYSVSIKEDHIDCPFRAGTLYIVYLGMMTDEEGNITYPFHPLITPYYEWTLKEKILEDAIFNSEMPNLGELLAYAKQKRLATWLDAFNFTTDSSYGQYVDYQRHKELRWYAKWFKWFQ